MWFVVAPWVRYRRRRRRRADTANPHRGARRYGSDGASKTRLTANRYSKRRALEPTRWGSSSQQVLPGFGGHELLGRPQACEPASNNRVARRWMGGVVHVANDAQQRPRQKLSFGSDPERIEHDVDGAK